MEIKTTEFKKLVDEKIGFLVGPLLFLIIIFLPAPAGLSVLGQKTLALFAWIIAWWILEPIPMGLTSLFGFFLVPVLGIYSVQDTFTAGFGANLLWLIFSVFLILHAFVAHGAGRRFALFMLSRKWIGTSTFRFLMAFSIATALLSAVVPNVPNAMIFMAIGLSIIGIQELNKGSKLAFMLMFIAGVGSIIGGFMTPVGATAPNFLMMSVVEKFTGYHISFLQWMGVGIPVALALIAALFFVIRIFPTEFKTLPKTVEWCRSEYKKLGAITRGEKNSIFALVLFIVLLLIPGISLAVFGSTHIITKTLQQYLPMAPIAVFCAFLTFIMPINWKERKFTLNFESTLKEVNWSIILFLAFVFAMSTIIADSKIGLISFATSGIKSLGFSPLGTFSVVSAITAILTQFTEALALIPVMGGIAAATATLGINAIAAILTVGFVSMIGFLLPIAGAPMAVIFGSGYVRMKDLIKIGGIMSLISTPIVLILTYFIGSIIFPIVSVV